MNKGQGAKVIRLRAQGSRLKANNEKVRGLMVEWMIKLSQLIGLMVVSKVVKLESKEAGRL